MRVLETFVFPRGDAYFALRFVRGSGLTGGPNHLDDLRLKVSATPAHGIRSVDKKGYCLIVGDAGTRRYRIEDPSGRMNARRYDASRPVGTMAGTGTGTGTGTGSIPAIGAAAVLRDLPLYAQQQATRLGAAGGIRGRLATAPEVYLPWGLVTGTWQQDGVTQVFVAQANERGEFALDLTGMTPPPDDSDPVLRLSVQAAAGLDPNTPPDPDAFSAWRVSADGTASGLAAAIDCILDGFGFVLKLGDLRVAPGLPGPGG